MDVQRTPGAVEVVPDTVFKNAPAQTVKDVVDWTPGVWAQPKWGDDTRLSIRTMGLKTGDAHIIRNAGGIVTDDSLRSLLVSHYLLETQEFMVINHTDCGLMHATEQELRTRIQNRAGTAAVAPAFFYAFQNIEENVQHQLQKLRTHPWIPREVAVRGFVYDVVSGRLREIKAF